MGSNFKGRFSRLMILATVVGLSLALGDSAAVRASGMDNGGDGGGVTIDLNGLLNSLPRREPASCRPPMVYVPQLGHCVMPVRVPSCPDGTAFAPRYNRCVPTGQPQVRQCDPPAVYSYKAHGCIVPPIRQAACKWPFVKQGAGCGCASGYQPSGSTCAKPPTNVATDVPHIQACLGQLGYYQGPADGKSGPGTVNGFVAFQKANGLGSRPDVLGDPPTQAKLYELCAAPPKGPEVATAPTSDNKPRCLPKDLYDTLKATYGDRPGVSPCVAACLPKPAFYSEAKLAAVAAKEGVDWCGSCIQLGAWLPLASILQIEGAAKVTLCASPPQLCYLPGRPLVDHSVDIRTIYKALPATVGHDGDLAVVIGNEVYQGDLPAHVYGHADADAVDKLLTEQLGFHKENIIDLRDASLADLDKVFGGVDNPKGQLAARIAEAKPENIFIYISSHGMAGGDNNAGYLLPVDVHADDLDHTAYPLQRLYANLGQAGARTIMMMLEGTFAKTITDLVDPPNIPQEEVDALPDTPVPGLAVFKASDRDQHTLEDPEYGIGLFTRYLIAGLAGEADTAPLGNGDHRIDSVELYVYTSDMVRTAARKSFGLEQKPLLSKIDNLVVGQLAAN